MSNLSNVLVLKVHSLFIQEIFICYLLCPTQIQSIGDIRFLFSLSLLYSRAVLHGRTICSDRNILNLCCPIWQPLAPVVSENLKYDYLHLETIFYILFNFNQFKLILKQTCSQWLPCQTVQFREFECEMCECACACDRCHKYIHD